VSKFLWDIEYVTDDALNQKKHLLNYGYISNHLMHKIFDPPFNSPICVHKRPHLPMPPSSAVGPLVTQNPSAAPPAIPIHEPPAAASTLLHRHDQLYTPIQLKNEHHNWWDDHQL
jgi:hypothetical protein